MYSIKFKLTQFFSNEENAEKLVENLQDDSIKNFTVGDLEISKDENGESKVFDNETGEEAPISVEDNKVKVGEVVTHSRDPYTHQHAPYGNPYENEEIDNWNKEVWDDMKKEYPTHKKHDASGVQNFSNPYNSIPSLYDGGEWEVISEESYINEVGRVNGKEVGDDARNIIEFIKIKNKLGECVIFTPKARAEIMFNVPNNVVNKGLFYTMSTEPYKNSDPWIVKQYPDFDEAPETEVLVEKKNMKDAINKISEITISSTRMHSNIENFSSLLFSTGTWEILPLSQYSGIPKYIEMLNKVAKTKGFSNPIIVEWNEDSDPDFSKIQDLINSGDLIDLSYRSKDKDVEDARKIIPGNDASFIAEASKVQSKLNKLGYFSKFMNFSSLLFNDLKITDELAKQYLIKNDQISDKNELAKALNISVEDLDKVAEYATKNVTKLMHSNINNFSSPYDSPEFGETIKNAISKLEKDGKLTEDNLLKELKVSDSDWLNFMMKKHNISKPKYHSDNDDSDEPEEATVVNHADEGNKIEYKSPVEIAQESKTDENKSLIDLAREQNQKLKLNN